MAFVLFCCKSIAQITQLELMSGPQKTDFTSFSIKPLHSTSQFSLGTLAFFQKFHQKENAIFDEAGAQPTIYWNLNRSISFGSGLYYNSIAGFSERLSILLAHRSAHFVLIAIPTIAHAEKTSTMDGELFMQMQFTKPLKKDWSLLIFAQMLTSWNKLSDHSRSFQQIRMGLKKKSTQFGLAMDLDQYGRSPLTRTSVGVFIRKTFQSN